MQPEINLVSLSHRSVAIRVALRALDFLVEQSVLCVEPAAPPSPFSLERRQLLVRKRISNPLSRYDHLGPFHFLSIHQDVILSTETTPNSIVALPPSTCCAHLRILVECNVELVVFHHNQLKLLTEIEAFERHLCQFPPFVEIE